MSLSALPKKNPERNTLKEPGVKRGFKLDNPAMDVDSLKFLIFGNAGTGKTFTAAQLLEEGFRVALLSTDLGDSGHITIKNRLIESGNAHLLGNGALVAIDGYNDVGKFLDNPWKWPISETETLGEFDPEFLYWDGFSYFQQAEISEHIGTFEDKKDKERGDFRDSGLVFEERDWGALRNATIRNIKNFLALRRPNGKPLHKVVTCLEDTKMKPVSSNARDGQTLVELSKPLIQGAGGRLILGGFDLICKTKAVDKRDAPREFKLIFGGHENQVAKNRGFTVEDVEPAEFGKLVRRLLNQLDQKNLTQTK